MLLKFQLILTRNGQVVKLQIDIDFSETPCIIRIYFILELFNKQKYIGFKDFFPSLSFIFFISFQGLPLYKTILNPVLHWTKPCVHLW